MAASAISPPPQTALTEFDRWMTSLYPIVQYGIGLLPSNNLSDLASAATARTNLGLTALATTAPGTGIATFLATPSSANLAAALTDETGTGAAVFANSPALTTPSIGDATGTSLVVSGTGGVGYSTGAGGSASQSTSKSTGVTVNKICGAVTMNNAALASGAKVSFTLSNNFIAASDGVVVWVKNGGTANAYRASANVQLAGAVNITVENISGGSLSEAVVIGFAVIKAVTA